MPEVRRYFVIDGTAEMVHDVGGKVLYKPPNLPYEAVFAMLTKEQARILKRAGCAVCLPVGHKLVGM